MKKLILLAVILLPALLMRAQEIFQIPNAADTYLTAINDSGEIAGYYTLANGNNIGFMINKYGDTITFTGPGGSNTYCAVTGLNNKGIIVGNFGSATDLSALQAFIYFPNPGRNAGGTYQIVPSWGGTYTSAADINADTCIAGSFHANNTNDGATWCYASQQLNDLRCNSHGTAIPTTLSCLDNNGNAGGFIIEGAQEQCAIYRSGTDSWDTFGINSYLKSRMAGMNDNGWICGSCSNGAVGYFAKKPAGQALSNFTQINIKNAVETYPVDINNRNEIVGYAVASNGTAVGFIIATYDIGFRPSRDGFTFNNGDAWDSNYYSHINYDFDPYLHNGTDTFPRHGNSIWNNESFPAWNDFVKAFVNTSFYRTVQGVQKIDRVQYNKWALFHDSTYLGCCFGFATMAGIIYDRPGYLQGLYPGLAPYASGNAASYPFNDSVLVPIYQIYSKQRSTSYVNIAGRRLNLLGNVQRVKQQLRNSVGKPHHSMGILNKSPAGGHELFPYRLVCNSGGNGIDTIYVYDCNYPLNDNMYVVSDYWHGTWTYNGFSPAWGDNRNKGLIDGGPDTIAATPLDLTGLWQQDGNSPFARSGDGQPFIAGFNPNSTVTLTDDSSQVTVFSADSTGGTSLIVPVPGYGGLGPQPFTQVGCLGQVTTINKITSAGTPNYLAILQDNYYLECDRNSGADSTDNYQVSDGSITYLNNNTGAQALNFTINVDTLGYEYNYYLTGLGVSAANKTTVSLYGAGGVQLQNYGAPTHYIITTTFFTDSVHSFIDTVSIDSNTLHIIQPHDTTHGGIYILVDNGMNGNYEDTIYVKQTITGLNSITAPGIKVWPVPANNQLFIAGPQGLVSYNIIDVTGRTVATGQLDFGTGETHSINTGSYAPGTYIIQATGKAGKWNYMFEKE